MFIVFLREFKALIRDIKAVACVTLFNIVSGIILVVNNLNTGYAGMEAVISVMTLVSAILIIFVSASSITKDKKAETEGFLKALPFTSVQRLLGKFFAILALFMISTAIIAVYPLVLVGSGFTALGTAYFQIFVFVLLEAFFISFGLLCSALFRKTLYAEIAAYSVMLVLFVLGVVAVIMPASALAGLICMLIVALLAGVCLWLVTKRGLLAAVVSGATALISVVLFFAVPAALEDSIEELFTFLSPFRMFDPTVYGFLDWAAILLYISFTILFLWLALFAQKHKRAFKQKPARPANMKLSAICTSVVAFCLCANIAVFALPDTVTKLDITQNRVYEISEPTIEYLNSLDEDINIYLIDANGSEEKLGNFIRRYCEHSSKIKLIEVDTAVDTDIVEKFQIPTNVSYYSIVVESGTRWQSVSAEKYYLYEHAELGYMTPSEYQYYLTYYQQLLAQYSQSSSADYTTLQQLQSMYLSLAQETTLCFQGEEAITTAIEYVRTEYIPTIYFLDGNGEKNTAANAVNINSITEIPYDAGMLFVNSPSEDYTESEINMLRTYMKNGGRLFVLTNEANLAMPNFMAFMAEYGLTAGGVLTEDESTAFDVTINTEVLPSTFSTVKLDGVSEITAAEGVTSNSLLSVKVTEKQTAEGESEPQEVTVSKNVGMTVYKNSKPQLTWISGADSFNANPEEMTEDEQTEYTYVMSMLQVAVNATKRSFEAENPYPTPRLYENTPLTIEEGSPATIGTIFIVVVPLIMLGVPLISIYARRRRSRIIVVED